MDRPLSLLTDAQLIAELAARGHEAQPPPNSHLPHEERRRLAATEPVGEHGLCPEAEHRLVLRTKLRDLRGAR